MKNKKYKTFYKKMKYDLLYQAEDDKYIDEEKEHKFTHQVNLILQ